MKDTGPRPRGFEARLVQGRGRGGRRTRAVGTHSRPGSFPPPPGSGSNFRAPMTWTGSRRALP